MNETSRITKLFKDLYDGNPWLDVNLVNTLSNISAEQAATKHLNWNSIWEITNHLLSWRLNVLERVKGEVKVTPPDNYFHPVTDTSEKAWKATLEELADTQEEWLSFLKEVKEQDFLKIYPVNNLSYYDHIQGILQHDAYHLGQIVLLAKLK